MKPFDDTIFIITANPPRLGHGSNNKFVLVIRKLIAGLNLERIVLIVNLIVQIHFDLLDGSLKASLKDMCTNLQVALEANTS